MLIDSNRIDMSKLVGDLEFNAMEWETLGKRSSVLYEGREVMLLQLRKLGYLEYFGDAVRDSTIPWPNDVLLLTPG